MIPLSTPATLKKFPNLLLLSLVASLAISLMFSTVSTSDSRLARGAVSLFIFPSWPLSILCLWYMWIFYPCFSLREGRRFSFDLAVFLSPLVLLYLFSTFQIEAAWSFVLSVLIFGFVMQDLIWESVDTLVIGPKLFSVYAVPCYVHVFFFLFYIFICQLIRPAYGMNGMSIYLVSLVSFLVGFLIRSLELKGLKES